MERQRGCLEGLLEMFLLTAVSDWLQKNLVGAAFGVRRLLRLPPDHHLCNVDVRHLDGHQLVEPAGQLGGRSCRRLFRRPPICGHVMRNPHLLAQR